jgi:archaellum component FlaC
MEHIMTQIPSWIVTAMIGLIGIGIGWGFFKSEVTHLKEDQVSQKIKTEGLITHCETFRSQCRDSMNSKFDEIKLALSNNKNIATTQFEEIKEFMGYVKRVIEEVNGKYKQ